MIKIKGLTSTREASISKHAISPSPMFSLKGSDKQALTSLKEVCKKINKKDLTNQKAAKHNKPTNIYKGGRIGTK